MATIIKIVTKGQSHALILTEYAFRNGFKIIFIDGSFIEIIVGKFKNTRMNILDKSPSFGTSLLLLSG
jgi:hypothetical protein